jgi:adenylosuccinate synthase
MLKFAATDLAAHLIFLLYNELIIMKVDVLLGLQWGDEGKGKIVDVITPGYDVVARFQGGPNAGHTIIFDNKKYVLHTIPSGIFNEKCVNLIGNGVIIDPYILKKELQMLLDSGLDPGKNLYVSRKAHLILPSHRLLDAASEASKGDSKIGSTLKGIGPAYTDKVSRNGLRVGDLGLNDFMGRYKQLRRSHFGQIEQLGFDFKDCKLDGLGFEEYENAWFDAVSTLNGLPHIDSEYVVNRMLSQGKKVLAEGAQGTMLDIDFGSYPFVTSSSTTIAGVCSGLGIPASAIGKVIGIFKAYCTRVGSGPFPTELHGQTGEEMRQAGNEFGSTTGRPRRCGWLDLPALHYAVMLNGVTELVMMKADVLDNFDTLQVGEAYLYKGKIIDSIPFDACSMPIKPVFKTMKGWKEPVGLLKKGQKLPDALEHYVRMIEKSVKVPITTVSTGPDRSQIIFRKG